MNLVLFENVELQDGSIPRRDDRALHLVKVLHKKPGDRFDAGVLGGGTGTAVITAMDEGKLYVSFTPGAGPPPRTPIRLAVGFPRPIQLRRLLRDCASLGLAAIDLIGTDLGEKSYRDTKLLKGSVVSGDTMPGGARSALMEGAAQARDTRLPHLAFYPSLAVWLASYPSDTPYPADIMLAAADNVQPQGSFAALGKIQAAVLAVGAERGWSSREREQLEAAGFRRLSLGSRALRTETACTAAAIILMEKMGLLG